MAAQVLEAISKDEKERILYESQLLYEADQEAEWSYRERRAIEKGREEGMEKGREEERLMVAKNLKLRNLPLDVISESTGLSLEVLRTL